jgi:hypothetical protein
MAGNSKSLPPLPKLIARLTGARLCFGSPVTANGRTVIPVASVRSAGGGGFGNSPAQAGTGGGGGGMLQARPVGFIEMSSEGTRFQRIDDGRTALRAIAAGSLAVLVAGRVLTRRRRGLPELGSLRRTRVRGRRTIVLPAPPPPSPSRRGLLARTASSARQLRGGQASQRS